MVVVNAGVDGKTVGVMLIKVPTPAAGAAPLAEDNVGVLPVGA